MQKRKFLPLFAGVVLAATTLIGTPAASAVAADPTPPAGSVLSVNGLRPGANDKVVKTESRFYAAKGNPRLKPATSNKASISSLTSCSSPCYTYNTGYQFVVAEGAAVNLTVHNAFRKSTDFHTLAELAVQSSDGQQAIEVGWTVDQALYGDNKPRLFVFRWINGIPTCYNACGFVDYAANAVNVGADLTSFAGNPPTVPPSNPRFQIQWSAGNWWIAFNGSWIGYYPDTLWSSPAAGQGPAVTFVKGGLIQAFGEIASSVVESCTDMGAGILGLNVNGTAGRIGSFSVINTTPAGVAAYFSLNTPPQPTKWTLEKVTSGSPPVTSNTTFRYGGPGWNAAGTATGIQNGC